MRAWLWLAAVALLWAAAARANEPSYHAVLEHSPGFHLVPEVAPLPSEVIFDKITMSAFEGMPLDIALRDCGINPFIIIGVARNWY